MHVLRTRFAVLITALSLAAAFSACGDGDGKGAAEDVEKGTKKGANKVEKGAKELEDDARGKDEKKQK